MLDTPACRFSETVSDSGNNAILLAPNVTSVPIPDNSFVPTYPYASGTYSDGPVWAQTLASMLGLSANPSLLHGTDYAFGGATTGPLNPAPAGLAPPSLEAQAAIFLSAHNGVAPGNALYVVEGGAEEVLHVLAAMPVCGGDPVCINTIVELTVASFTRTMDNIVSALQRVGEAISLSGMCRTLEMRQPSVRRATRRWGR